ncbi:MAG: hypothetical protein ACTS6G_00600 [Candidatus Hodgkinia cicadicola]
MFISAVIIAAKRGLIKAVNRFDFNSTAELHLTRSEEWKGNN